MDRQAALDDAEVRRPPPQAIRTMSWIYVYIYIIDVLDVYLYEVCVSSCFSRF